MKIKRNKSGTLLMFNFLGKQVYFFSSKRGTYRGGKYRNREKKFIVLFGLVNSMTHEDNQEISKTVEDIHVQVVPAGTPHLLFMKKYSWVIEWWDKSYTEEKFEPFYLYKNKDR